MERGGSERPAGRYAIVSIATSRMSGGEASRTGARATGGDGNGGGWNAKGDDEVVACDSVCGVGDIGPEMRKRSKDEDGGGEKSARLNVGG